MKSSGKNLLETLLQVSLIVIFWFNGAILKAELPSSNNMNLKNKIDQINSRVKSFCATGRLDLAVTEKQKVFKLGVTVPNEEYFDYAVILINYSNRMNFQARTNAKLVLEKYMTLVGKAGQNYNLALELREELEKMDSYKACGMEWKFLQTNVTWDEAQNLIKTLGNDWRAPTRAELKCLYDEVENQSPIKDGWAWSGESKDSYTAWYFGFNFGKEYCYYRGIRAKFCLAVAVRPLKNLPSTN
ncbi:MAG: DUF1566 domain-containing protein [Candidatus Riflebacteria bacterium]|nr:DUF1566 domain-containing protein [Candidatus Riflebacteria bacterium]